MAPAGLVHERLKAVHNAPILQVVTGFKSTNNRIAEGPIGT